MVAYASIDDLLALFETEPKATRQAARFEPLLEVATQELIDEAKRDFFRHPTTGSATWLADGDGSCWLHLHRGLIELETLELSFDGGRTFVEVDEDDFELTWQWKSSDEPLPGEPYFHVRLVPGGTYSTFPRGTGTVRVTGAAGWAAVPTPLVEGTAERARQLAYADPSYEGSVPADDAYGQPTVTGRWPHVTWSFLRREARRFAACDT